MVVIKEAKKRIDPTQTLPLLWQWKEGKNSASHPGFAKHGVDKEHQVYKVWPVVHLPVAKQQG